MIRHNQKKRILIIQPDMNKPSGGNVVNNWVIQALYNDYEVTVMTLAKMDFNYVNSWCTTSLKESDFKTLILPKAIQFLIGLIPEDKWDYQQQCVLMRWCKIIRNRFDIIMTASNECDFGKRGIQYVHYPYHREKYFDEPRSVQKDGFLRFVHRYLKYRLRPWRIISGFSYKRMVENLALVNSEWSKKVYRDAYSAGSVKVYPPIPGRFTTIPWNERENGFVCIGRISSEKRYENIIDILLKVKSHYPDIHLHIIGSRVEYDSEYYEIIYKMVSDNSDWISLHENIPHSKLADLVCHHRYGIHAMPDEHFGIAVGEMVRGGCITFVPDGGGQVEIIGNEPRLLYRSDEEAVEKILHVLADAQEQNALQKRLAARIDLFTTDKFIEQMQQIIQDFSRGIL